MTWASVFAVVAMLFVLWVVARVITGAPIRDVDRFLAEADRADAERRRDAA